HGPLIRLVRLRPVALQLGFAQYLSLPGDEAPAIGVQPRLIAKDKVGQPGADDGLEQNGKVARTWPQVRCGGPELCRGERKPSLDGAAPFLRQFAQPREP